MKCYAESSRIASAVLPGSRDVFCYFDNDQKVRAAFDARRLMQRLDAEQDQFC